MWLVLLSSLLVWWPSLAWADPTIDNVTSAEANIGTPNTLSYSTHTVAADANGALVGLCERDTNASGFTADTATVTIGGVSATQILGVGNGTNMRAVLFQLLAPATGTPTISVTGDTGTDRLIVGTMSLKGVKPTGSFNTAGSNAGVGTTNADIDALASAANELAVLLGCVRTSTVTPSADATAPVSTEQLDVAHTDATSLRVFLYTEAGAATSIDMRVDLSGSGDWAAVGVSVRSDVNPFGAFRRRL